MAISPYIAGLRRRIGHDLLLVPGATVLPWDEQGRVLLVLQADSGTWATIGGSVEPGESPQEAAVREAAEEAGIEVALRGIRAVLGGAEYLMRYSNGDEVAYVSTVFDAVITAGQPRADQEETLEVRWFRPDELAGLEMTAFDRLLCRGCGLLPEGG